MFTTKRHFDGMFQGPDDKEPRLKNPKIASLLDEIINDGSPVLDNMDVTSHKSLLTSTEKQNNSSPDDVIRQVIPQQTLLPLLQTIVPPKSSAVEVIAEVFPPVTEKELLSTPPPPPPPHVVHDVFPPLAMNTKPRTIGDIVGFSDSDGSEEDR